MKTLVVILMLAFSTLNAQWQQISGLPYNSRTWGIYPKGDSLYVCNDLGLYISPNAGQSWVKKSDIIFNTITSKNNFLLGGGRYGTQKGIWKSFDGGSSWTQTGMEDRVINSIKYNGEYNYVGTDWGLYRAVNNEYSWWKSKDSVMVYDIAVNGSNVFAVCGKIYRSTNNGNNWTVVKDTNGFRCIATDGVNIYVGSSGESYSRGVWKSSNNGNTWVRIGLSDSYVYSIAITGNYVIAGTSNNGVNVYNGTIWFNRTQGLPVPNSAIPLVVSNNYIYTGVIGNSPEYSTWKRSISNTIDVKKISSEVPSKFELLQNYPNPFNPSTTIRYQISQSQFVNLRVFDITGKEIAVLVNEKQSAGTYEVRWDASKYSSGTYFYRLNDVTRECILIK